MMEFDIIRKRNENPTTCRVLKSVAAFVNVDGREPVLNPGPLSWRFDKSSTQHEVQQFINVVVFHTIFKLF
jgi:hypothetical protein